MRSITVLGDPPVIVLGVVFMAAFSRGVTRRASLDAVAGLLVTFAVAQALKRWAVRARPKMHPGVIALVRAPDRFSFPSGHAAAALAVALPFAAAFGGPFATITLGLGLLVGVSRCYLGLHYPSDVLAGWSLAGLVWILLRLTGWV